MTKSEIITSKGCGLWGGTKYEVQLLTSYRKYSDSTGKNTKTVVRYALAFGSMACADRRWFESEAARHSFIEKSFSDLAMSEVPESEREPREVASPLGLVVGEYLSSVTFVMDYLQLAFSGYTFNMYDWPAVTSGGQTVVHSDHGYRDAICALIGKTLKQIDVYLDRGLAIQFEDDSSLTLSLRVGKDFPCPEVAEFRGPRNVWVIWQVGEEPFD